MHTIGNQNYTGKFLIGTLWDELDLLEKELKLTPSATVPYPAKRKAQVKLEQVSDMIFSTYRPLLGIIRDLRTCNVMAMNEYIVPHVVLGSFKLELLLAEIDRAYRSPQATGCPAINMLYQSYFKDLLSVRHNLYDYTEEVLIGYSKEFNFHLDMKEAYKAAKKKHEEEALWK